MNRADYEFVLGLLREGKMAEARAYLGDSDDPMAKQWLNALTVRPVPKPQPKPQPIKPAPTPKPKQAEIKPIAKPITKPVVQITPILLAWKRDISNMSDKGRLIGQLVVIAGSIGVAWLLMPTLVCVFGLLLMLALGLYAASAQEITSTTIETGAVERQYDWFSWIHYQVKALPSREVRFPKGNFKLKHPPSAALMSVMGVRDATHSATLLIRGSLIALWGQGYLQIREVRVARGFFGNTSLDATPTYFIVPGEQLEKVTGGLERLIATKVAYWQRNHPAAVDARPWCSGPTPYELVLDMLGAGGGAAQRLIDAVRREMIENKAFNPKTGNFADGLRADGEAVIQAIALLGREQREVDSALQTKILAAVQAKSR